MSYKRKSFVMFFMSHAAIVMALSFAALFSGFGWFPELCSHFYVQYLVILFALMVVLALARTWKILLIVIPFILICLFKIVPLYLPANTPASSTGAKLSVMTINVNTQNRNIKAVVNQVRHYLPDVISFEEVDDWWLGELKNALSKEYPYCVAKTQSDNFGIAEFSKVPSVKSQIIDLGNPPVPAIWGQYVIAGKTVSIVSIHTLPPANPLYLFVRNGQMSELAKMRSQLGDYLVIAGDLNCTPFSQDFDSFLKGTGTVNSMRGFGLQFSWPALFPYYPFLLIPIDHILASPNFACVKREIGLPIGSDHFPVYAELQLLH